MGSHETEVWKPVAGWEQSFLVSNLGRVFSLPDGVHMGHVMDGAISHYGYVTVNYGTDEHEGHWLTGEEIVRCRDCKRFSLDNSDHDYRSGWWCHRWNTDMIKPDGFCAWGERRDE